MEFEAKSKVYIQTDNDGRILRCDGGYTTPTDFTDWIEIDEGTGDKYNLCQTHYFDGGLYTNDGIPRYEWNGEAAVLRSEDAIEQDRASVAQPKQPEQPEQPEQPAQQETDSSVWDELDAAYREGVNSAYDS